MLSERLIRIIETHAEELTRGAVKKLQSSPHTRSYHDLSPDELHHRLFDVYHDLGRWLFKNTDHEIQLRYEEVGRRRCKEGVPLAEVLWSLVLTKDHLRECIGNSMSADSALELHREQEIYRLIGRFFDRAICYAAEAYEREASIQRDELVAAIAH
ncbi:MAG: hypothetical protein ACLQVG_14150 [Terriglobia bacterium]